MTVQDATARVGLLVLCLDSGDLEAAVASLPDARIGRRALVSTLPSL